jgi:hypothetical protein
MPQAESEKIFTNFLEDHLHVRNWPDPGMEIRRHMGGGSVTSRASH